MLSALVDGRAMTASELALAARITPQTASTHLGKLTKAGVLSVDRNGRHRHFRLASPKVVEMIEGIVAVALENRPRFRRYRLKHAQSVRPGFATTILRAVSALLSPILWSPANSSCSTTRPPQSRPQALASSKRSGSRFPHRARFAARFADSASIGPSAAHALRVLSGPRSPDACSISAGWRGPAEATQ
jgi:DNA-binding transcriptional ArsR family regulator